MSIQTDPVATGSTNGPGLAVANGLPVPASAVNQSAGTAQVQHHPGHHQHDPYATNYPSYSNVVTYGAPYSTNVNSLPSPYYSHTSHSHPSQHAQADPHNSVAHHEHTQHHSDDRAHEPHHQHLHDMSHQDTMQTHPHSHHGSVAYHSPLDGSPHEHSPPSPSATSNAPASIGKRGAPASPDSEEEQAPAQKRRKQRASIAYAGGETSAESLKEEGDLGPGGGAKHWTDEEKSKLFHWMLDDDERWEAFGTKMNTIFREGSAQLFNTRKTFTALKSCYHRNLDVFKQIYAFEAFLARASTTAVHSDSATQPSSSSSPNSEEERDAHEVANSPLPPSFASAMQRQAFLERKLDAARTLNVPVGNLTIRVLDHWQEKGWYATFKKRFKEDSKTGLPVPRHASDRDAGMDTSASHSALPPPMARQQRGSDSSIMQADGEGEDRNSSGHHSESQQHTPISHVPLTDAQRRHLDPADCLIPPPFPSQPATSRPSSSGNRAQRPSTPPSAQYPPGPVPAQHSPQAQPFSYPSHAAPVPFYGSPSMPPDYHFQQQMHLQAQTTQALTHLTNLTQTLLGTMNTLTDLARAQMEESKLQTELLRRREEREDSLLRSDGGGAAQRAAAASDVLSNPRLSEEVKKAASDYLKRLFQ